MRLTKVLETEDSGRFPEGDTEASNTCVFDGSGRFPEGFRKDGPEVFPMILCSSWFMNHAFLYTQRFFNGRWRRGNFAIGAPAAACVREATEKAGVASSASRAVPRSAGQERQVHSSMLPHSMR